MKPETKFKIRFSNRLDTYEKLWYVKTQETSSVGIPDYLICFYGIFIAVEIKASADEDLRPMQEYTLEKIAKAQGITLTVHPDNEASFFRLLDSWAKKYAKR